MQNPLFIPVVLAALSLNSVIANAADKQTATIVHGGTVHFVGELVNAACAVTTESSNLTVALGQHHIARLNQAGDKTTPVKFQIKLEDCDNTLATSAAIAFYGQTSNIDPNLLVVNALGSGTTAKNVGIEISDHSAQVIKPDGNNFSTAKKLLQASNILDFTARYVATGDTTVGQAHALATFVVKYD